MYNLYVIIYDLIWAAHEAMEAQGIFPKSTSTNIPPVTNGVASEITQSAVHSVTPADKPVQSNTSPRPTNDDPILGASNGDWLPVCPQLF